MREILKTLLAIGLLLITFVLIEEYLIERPTCYAHWEYSGLRARWSLWGDCQVEVTPNKWIPAKNYREVP